MADCRYVPCKIGDQISAGNCIMIDGISTVVAVKYNGISDTYDLCKPEQATHDAIITDDDHCIVISKKCVNREAIIDIL